MQTQIAKLNSPSISGKKVVQIARLDLNFSFLLLEYCRKGKQKQILNQRLGFHRTNLPFFDQKQLWSLSFLFKQMSIYWHFSPHETSWVSTWGVGIVADCFEIGRRYHIRNLLNAINHPLVQMKNKMPFSM